jgi:hypothetical protein
MSVFSEILKGRLTEKKMKLGQKFSHMIEIKKCQMSDSFFYLPYMEYEGSFGFVSRKMKNFYCWFSRFKTFYG